MTGRADFTDEEWQLLTEGPAGAGTLVVLSQRGGTIRETFSMAKEYAETRQNHGASQLLDEIVSAKPQVDRTKHANFAEMKDHTLDELRQAVALLEEKAAPDELADYRRFVLAVAERVAKAHKEHGQEVSEAEQATIEEIKAAIGASA